METSSNILVRLQMRLLLLHILFPLLACSQSWDFSFVEFVMEDIPLWKAVIETERNGYWDLGDGRSVKAVVFELGGCSKGHPCASATGLPWLYPEGCDTSKCVNRFLGDPWLDYDWDCRAIITADNLEWQKSRFGNMTQISTESFQPNDTSCLIRYLSESNTWELGASGVGIVLKAHGFTFPPQTVIISDVDSVDDFFRFTWPDVMQEVSINFAMLEGILLKPRNTYALDHYDISLLINSPPSLTQINVTLLPELLRSLELETESTWVMGSISALTSDRVYDFVEFNMPDHWRDVAGGSVWVEISTEFDTWVSSMSVARKASTDRDQRMNINPLKAVKRCKCSLHEKASLVVLPILGSSVCMAQVLVTKSYSCNEAGNLLCNEIRFTAWDKQGPENTDGTVPCSPRNSTKPVYYGDMSSTETIDWSAWPTGPVVSPTLL